MNHTITAASVAHNRSTRWFLIAAAITAVVVFAPHLHADITTAAGDSNQQGLDLNSALTDTTSTPGWSIIKKIYLMVASILTVIAAALGLSGIIAFLNTNEWGKMKNVAVGLGLFFAFGGLFWAMFALSK